MCPSVGDVDADPLVGLLGGRAELEGRRYPMALFADGSTLEGPERFMLNRYVPPPARAALPGARRMNGPTRQRHDSSSNSPNGSACRPDRRTRSMTSSSLAPAPPG